MYFVSFSSWTLANFPCLSTLVNVKSTHSEKSGHIKIRFFLIRGRDEANMKMESNFDVLTVFQYGNPLKRLVLHLNEKLFSREKTFRVIYQIEISQYSISLVNCWRVRLLIELSPGSGSFWSVLGNSILEHLWFRSAGSKVWQFRACSQRTPVII